MRLSATRFGGRRRRGDAADSTGACYHFSPPGEVILSELELCYTCPSCSENFSIAIERIPPVRARFPCEKCGEVMDFPSRDQARIQAKLQAESARKSAEAEERVKTTSRAADGKPFRVDKRGWEDDNFTRRDIHLGKVALYH